MKAKDKAKELVEKFKKVNITFQPSAFSNIETYPLNEKEAKQCALICVEEIKECLSSNIYLRYWQEVKKEIENL